MTSSSIAHRLKEVKDYLRNYGFTVSVHSADNSYALFTRDSDYKGRHTHVSIEVRINIALEITYEVGAMLPETYIQVTSGKTTNAALVWRYAEIIDNVVSAAKVNTDAPSNDVCEIRWRYIDNG